MILTFDEETHVYRVDGCEVDSVTRLITAAGRGVDYSAVPAFILEQARERGLHVDLACDLDDADLLDEGSVFPPWLGYVQGWRRYKATHHVTVLRTQLRLYHPVYHYAGSPDALVLEEGGTPVVTDRKATKQLHTDPYGLQLAAYTLPGILMADPVTGELAPLEPRPAARRIVQLHAGGGYVPHLCDDPEDFTDWLAVLERVRADRRLEARTKRYAGRKEA
jgi:hypothetical protein